MSAQMKYTSAVVQNVARIGARAKDMGDKLQARIDSCDKALDIMQHLHNELAEAEDLLRSVLAVETNGPPTP